jgi:hypothetical protein
MGNNNLDYCSKKAIEKVESVLNNPEVSDLSKYIIRMGLNKDCVDVVSYVQLAANTLREVREDILR